ncbi:MAG: sigma-70 family RNA polymerase sigma factor [Nannocystaceae bacterium]|nr:sigma-70 family RNA polymerase sigma factor [Nannocystaceae bacterium]
MQDGPTQGAIDVEADDAHLLECWRDGDTEAGHVLLQRHFRSVYSFFVNKVDAANVDDLIQETFAHCIESRDRIRNASSFRAYLLSIARHRLFHLYRARTKEEKFLARETTASKFVTSPSTLLVRHEQSRILLQALRSISIEHQIVLELTYWEHLSTSESADVLEVPLGTLKSRVRRAREALRVAFNRLSKLPEHAPATLDDLERWARSARQAIGVPNDPAAPRIDE